MRQRITPRLICTRWMPRCLWLALFASVATRAADAPVDDAPPTEAKAKAKADDSAKPAAAAAPAPRKQWTRPPPYPMNPASLQPKRPDGVLGDDIEQLGHQLQVSGSKLREGAGAQPLPETSPRGTIPCH